MSERLIRAIDDFKELPEVTLGTIVDKIGDESLLIVSLICVLPFMQPIPIPGVSTILGLIVFLQGVGLIVKGKPLLTKRMRAVVLTNDRMMLIYRAAQKFDRFASKLSAFKHPVIGSRGVRIFCGFTIILVSAFLSLPLPIPFSNFVPALCLFFICAGLLENDLVLVLFGHAIAITVLWMGIASYEIIVTKFNTWF